MKEINQLLTDSTKPMEAQKQYNTVIANSSDSFKAYSKTVSQGSQSFGGYLKYLTKSTTHTVLLTLKTIALQVAITGGLTLAIGAITSAIDAWINKEERLLESINSTIEKTKEEIASLEEEQKTLKSLTDEAEELATKNRKNMTDNEIQLDNQRLYEIQESINSTLKDEEKQIELIIEKTDEWGKAVLEVNENYDQQLIKLRAIDYEKQKQIIVKKL